jgi:hypothetical protein
MVSAIYNHFIASLLLLLVSKAIVLSQELEPLTYTNAPVGMHVLAVGTGYTEGAVLPDPSVPLEDAFVKTNASLLAYVQTLDLWGKSGRFGLVLPYATLDGSGIFFGEAAERKFSGFADPLMKFQINFIGAPALKLRDFMAYKQDTIVGFRFTTIAPWGQYDPDKLANIGTNRWSFKPEIGISKAIENWTLELSQAAKFFTDNDNFFGGQHREQAVFHATRAHVIYHFNRTRWLNYLF